MQIYCLCAYTFLYDVFLWKGFIGYIFYMLFQKEKKYNTFTEIKKKKKKEYSFDVYWIKLCRIEICYQKVRDS